MNRDEIRQALRELERTLEPVVVGPPASSLPAIRARYIISLTRQMLDDEKPWRAYTQRLVEWDQHQKKTLKTKEPQ